MADTGNTPDKITYFAETDYRSKRIKFGIRDEDRAKHMYIIGKTGMGKSTLLENLAIQDIQNGEGICFIDPHGGTAEVLLSYVPEDRINDVIYFAPFDQEFPVALNVMEDLGKDKRPLIASGLIGAFKKVWVDAWSARMEYLLSNALLALLEFPGATLLGVNRIFADKNYRNLIVSNVKDPSVKSFWLDEFAKYTDKFATEATAAIQNKIGQFAANPLIRNMVGQPVSTFDLRDVMDKKKILIVNLSKGRMGEGNANLVGSMLITKIYLAAMSRADVGPEVVKSLPNFYLYVDEFQSFANESFADILSEARKYKLSLTIAHQYIEQMSDEVRAAVFGNVGTMISFRVGAYDAEVLEKEFAPAFLAEDMVNLGFTQVYLKLMIRGVGSPPFSASTSNRPKEPVHNFAKEVVEASRKQFARPRAQVEAEITKWHEPIPDAPRDPNAPYIPETKKYAPGMRPVRPAGVGGGVPGAFGNQMNSYAGGGGASRPYTPRPDSYTQGSAPVVYSQERVAPTQVIDRPRGQEVTPNAPRAYVAPISEPSVNALYEAVPRRPMSHTITPEPLVSVFPLPISVPKKIPQVDLRVNVSQVAPLFTPPQQESRAMQEMVRTPVLEVHQPFRNQLSEMASRPKFQGVEVAKPFQVGAIKRRENQPPYAAPYNREQQKPEQKEKIISLSGIVRSEHTSLSSLKTEQKKDKGPSTENLSTLKAALEAALAKGKQKTVIPEMSRTKKTEEDLRAVPTPAVPETERPPRQVSLATEPEVSPYAQEAKREKIPVPLLDETFSQSPKEVPEDILRKVLAD